MITQTYKVGDKVILVSETSKWSNTVHTVITVSPVYEERPFRRRISNLLDKKIAKRIIGYKYRCKSNLGMADFLQEELCSASGTVAWTTKKTPQGTTKAS